MEIRVHNYIDEDLQIKQKQAIEKAKEKEQLQQEFQATLEEAMNSYSSPNATKSTSSIGTPISGNNSNSSIYSGTDSLGCPAELEPYFQVAADTYGVDVNLLKAIAKQESAFTSNAVSKSGAVGIMQLMPQTASYLGVTDSYNSYQNIMGGAKFISSLLQQYNGNVSLALAAYNAGPNAVEKYNGIPPYEETQNYVAKVTEYYSQASTGNVSNNTTINNVLPGSSGTNIGGNGLGDLSSLTAADLLSLKASIAQMLDMIENYTKEDQTET